MKIDETVLGNRANEEGAAIQGADFSTLNRGSLPESRPDVIEVDAEKVADGIQLTPKEDWVESVGLTLRQGPRDILDAQLMEEPEQPPVKLNGIEVIGSPLRISEISQRSPREALIWYGMHPEYYGAMAGDRIMLKRDVMESQYSCKGCRGKGFQEDDPICGNCKGSQKETVNTAQGPSEVPCRACRVIGYGKETSYSSGYKPCDRCMGSGWKNGIVIPEESQAEAITGVVVSVGPECRMWKIGDRLIFSRYAGHTLQVSKTDDYVMMRESEALGILRQR